MAKYNITPVDTKWVDTDKAFGEGANAKSVHELLSESSKVGTDQTCVRRTIVTSLTSRKTSRQHHTTAQQHAQSWRSDGSPPWMSHPVGPGKDTHSTLRLYDGRLWVARLTRTQHATKVASTTRCINRKPSNPLLRVTVQSSH